MRRWADKTWYKWLFYTNQSHLKQKVETWSFLTSDNPEHQNIAQDRGDHYQGEGQGPEPVHRAPGAQFDKNKLHGNVFPKLLTSFEITNS
jgi:hypothetical protein